MRNKELFRGRRKAGRIVGLVLTLALAVSLLSGCGQSKERLTFGTGGTAGTYYSYGGVLAQYITNNTNVKVTAVSTGGSKANLQSVQDGDFQLGFVQSDVMAYAWDGVRAFEQDGATHDFRTLAWNTDGADIYYQGTTDKELPVGVQLTYYLDGQEIAPEDLKGKSVSIGAANSGVYFNALDVLNAGGITLDDIHPQYLSFEDSKESLKDGKIDAAFIVAGAPTTAITELATTNGVYMINIDGAIRDSILSDCPYYTSYQIPAGTYPGQDEPVETITVKATIVVSESLDEDTVYDMTAAIFDHADEISAENAKGAELSLENATSGMTIPFLSRDRIYGYPKAVPQSHQPFIIYYHIVIKITITFVQFKVIFLLRYTFNTISYP